MFEQSPYQCRMEWGSRGAREAAERGDIIIIVDVLSFSTTVTTAIHHGAIIFPYPAYKDGKESNYAKEVGAELIFGRAESMKLGNPPLPPIIYKHIHKHKKYVLCSLNGALCSWVAAKVPALLVGSLLNASAVAAFANKMQAQTGAAITVIACGEQWEEVMDGENKLRPAIEDYLGAGAILSKLNGGKSPEADLCVNAFKGVEGRVKELMMDCGSGRELILRGFEQDVIHAAQMDVFKNVPILTDLYFTNAEV
ncbi:MAG: 2-phosphosulfolactate phosphatase [Heyndrickxia sp.]